MSGWGCFFTVSPTAIILSESEQLVVAIDLLPPSRCPLPHCVPHCVYMCMSWLFIHIRAGICIHDCMCISCILHIYECLYTLYVFECMSVWWSACFSFPENSPWGDSKSSQLKFFLSFFKPSSHSGRPSLLWASRGAPRMGRGFAGRGGGPEWDLAPFVRPGRG